MSYTITDEQWSNLQTNVNKLVNKVYDTKDKLKVANDSLSDTKEWADHVIEEMKEMDKIITQLAGNGTAGNITKKASNSSHSAVQTLVELGLAEDTSNGQDQTHIILNPSMLSHVTLVGRTLKLIDSSAMGQVKYYKFIESKTEQMLKTALAKL